MIRTNELRLGNYFFIGGLDRYVKVNSVFLSHFKCTDENGIDFNNHQNNIQPIELTEEILLKCGFVTYSKTSFLIEDCPICIRMESKEIEVDSYLLNGNMFYLHQLQNLYFALTGKELNIEL